MKCKICSKRLYFFKKPYIYNNFFKILCIICYSKMKIIGCKAELKYWGGTLKEK